MKSIALGAARFIVLDVLGDMLYFPFWWYSKGLVRAFKLGLNRVKRREANLGVWLWIKNLFVPMFGQRDFTGKLISFAMRIVQIIFRSLFLLVTLIWEIILFLAWIAAPIFVVEEIFWHFKLIAF